MAGSNSLIQFPLALCESDGENFSKIRIRSLKVSNLGVTEALFYPFLKGDHIPTKCNSICLFIWLILYAQPQLTDTFMAKNIGIPF